MECRVSWKSCWYFAILFSLQDTDKILMDLSFDDGAHRGIKDAFPEANIAPKGSKGIYQNCKPRQSLCLISLKYGTIANERIIFRTELVEHVNLRLNCRENLVLTTATVRLQLSVMMMMMMLKRWLL